MTPFPATNPAPTIGDSRLCAWATSESSVRIQTRDPAIAKRLARVPDCRRVGFSVTGAFLRIYAMPYHLPWVAENVIQKLNREFPRENEASKTDFAPRQAESN